MICTDKSFYWLFHSQANVLKRKNFKTKICNKEIFFLFLRVFNINQTHQLMLSLAIGLAIKLLSVISKCILPYSTLFSWDSANISSSPAAFCQVLIQECQLLSIVTISMSPQFPTCHVSLIIPFLYSFCYNNWCGFYFPDQINDMVPGFHLQFTCV